MNTGELAAAVILCLSIGDCVGCVDLGHVARLSLTGAANIVREVKKEAECDDDR